MATFGTAAVLVPMMPPITPPMEPPGTPPGTPPMTPAVVGGASSSWTIFTFSGILVGVRSSLFTSSVCTCTTCTGAAGGGGGGGGGGGASSKVDCSPLGNASVKISGINTTTPTKMNSMMNEIVVV